MDRKYQYWLWGIFLATFIIRIIIAFTVPHFTYESYFHLRQVEQISQTGLPLYNDPLSYGGRQTIFLPFFQYFMAFFDFFLPLEFAAKIIPNLLLASLVLLVYLIAKKITAHEPASLWAALIAGFLPTLFTPNAFTPKVLFLPLLFLNIYAFLNLKDKKYLYVYILTFLLLCLTSGSTALIIIGMGIYLLLRALESKKIEADELELIIFSVFFFIWSQFLFFKSTFLSEGLSFIWKNIPPQIISQYFPEISITQALVLVSIIPFLAGIYVVFRSLFQLKNQPAFFLISLVISTTLLAWLKLLEFQLSLAFFGIILAILFAIFYQESSAYLGQTKLSRVYQWYPFIILVLLAISTIYPAVATAFNQDTPTDSEIEAFRWLDENTPEDAGVLALLEEGHLVTYYAQRRNIMDDRFGSVRNIEQRFQDLNSLFTTSFETQALALLEQYQVQYLVLTPAAQQKYDLAKFRYFTRGCFQREYEQEGTKIYMVKCTLQELP